MHKWKVIDGWVRRCEKCGRKEAHVWFSILFPKIRFFEPQQTLGWPFKWAIIAIELRKVKIFRWWKCVDKVFDE